MGAVRIWLVALPVCLACCLAPGWFNPVSAAEDKVKAVPAPTTGGPETPSEECPPGTKPEPSSEECPSTFGPIITDTAIPIAKGMFSLQSTMGPGVVTNNFSPSWRRISAGGNFSTFGVDVKLSYGLWDNLEVFAAVPYIHNWAGQVNEPGPRGERSADFGGIGDVNLTFKYMLLPEGPVAPTVSALFAVDFPTGHFRHLNPGRLGTDAIGGGTYAFTTGLNISKYLKPFILYGNFWYTLQTDYDTEDADELGNPLSGRNHPRDYVTVNLAAEYPLWGKWVALLELTSTWDGGRLIGPQANVAPTALLSVLPGIEYMATEKFSLALGVNVDLVGKETSGSLTPLLSMVYGF